HELTLGDVEAGVAEGDDLRRIALGDVLEADHGETWLKAAPTLSPRNRNVRSCGRCERPGASEGVASNGLRAGKRNQPQFGHALRRWRWRGASGGSPP